MLTQSSSPMEKNIYHCSMFTYLTAAQQLGLEPGSLKSLGGMVSRVTSFNLIILNESPFES